MNNILAFILGAAAMHILHRFQQWRLERMAREVEDEIMSLFSEVDGFWVATEDGVLFNTGYRCDCSLQPVERNDDMPGQIWHDALEDIDIEDDA